MITITNKQAGSAHLVIISVLAVALIAALGFIFWTNVIKSDDTPKEQAKTSSSPLPQVAADEENSDTITLADWKVQFSIPDSLKTTGVEYAQQTKNGATEYGFTTARIKALGGDCKTEPYGKAVVLNRSKTAPQGMDGFAYINKEPLDGYYYTYRETIPMCSGDMSDPAAKTSDVEVQDRQYLSILLKSLKAL